MKRITIYDQYQISVHVRSIPGGEHAGGMVRFCLNGIPRLTNSWPNRYTVIGFRGRVSRRSRSIQLTIARGNSRPAVKVRESGDRLNRCNSGTDGTVRMGENHSQARCALKRSLKPCLWSSDIAPRRAGRLDMLDRVSQCRVPTASMRSPRPGGSHDH